MPAAGSNYFGMAVPGASSLFGQQSPADQVAGETEEQRRKRLASLMASRAQPGVSALLGAGYGAAAGG